MVIGLDSRPKQRDDVLAQRGSDTTYLLHVREGEYYALSDVGDRIWELCDGERSLAQIASILGDEYDAPQETLEADLIELINDLARHQLVVVSP